MKKQHGIKKKKDAVHVYPERDVIEHNLGNGGWGCFCNPQVERYDFCDLIIHNVLNSQVNFLSRREGGNQK